jgi:hypothetical protein
MEPVSPADLSPLAEKLLREMAKSPSTVEYHTRVLGGMFKEESIQLLDQAYAELLGFGLIESAGAVISFFGVPKRLYKITAKGAALVKEAA